MKIFITIGVLAFLSVVVPQEGHQSTPMQNAGASLLLVPDTSGMETAWDLPRNPLTDSTLGNSHLDRAIRQGFRLFIGSHDAQSDLARNKVTCGNCHLNAGQRLRALPLVGIAGIYPEYNKRAGRLFSLEDRIVECYKRSLDASRSETSAMGEAKPLSTESAEVLAVSAYISWLSTGQPTALNVHWRGLNGIPPERLIPVERLDRRKGEALFREKCANCHGADGQGVEIGDKKPGPLWGKDSWNDGAGAGRVYTLAGMIRYMMPYMDPSSLTDEEAQEIAAFIDAQPRPSYPFKNLDYAGDKIPPDAVYYRR